MMRSESPLDDDASLVFASASLHCVKMFGLTKDDDPKKIIYAIDAMADAWQQGSRPPLEVLDATDAPYVLGSAWGDQFVRAFGWKWVIHRRDGADWPAVRSSDRRFAIYPFSYLTRCFDEPSIDITIALAFNMVSAGTVVSAGPDEYRDLMSMVRRVVPRR